MNRRAFVSDFWKKGLLAGSNADTVLLRIDADERDDFLEAFEGAKYLYKGVLRTRTLFASLLYRDYAAVRRAIGLRWKRWNGISTLQSGIIRRERGKR